MRYLIAARGYDANALRRRLNAKGAEAVIPEREPKDADRL